jgi:hypothetical protein
VHNFASLARRTLVEQNEIPLGKFSYLFCKFFGLARMRNVAEPLILRHFFEGEPLAGN